MSEKIIKNGTKVLVHSKSTGCSLYPVMKRYNKRTNTMKKMKVPYDAWVSDYLERGYGKVERYVLVYSKDDSSGGGDYYLRGDFTLAGSIHLLSDDDFLL